MSVSQTQREGDALDALCEFAQLIRNTVPGRSIFTRDEWHHAEAEIRAKRSAAFALGPATFSAARELLRTELHEIPFTAANAELGLVEDACYQFLVHKITTAKTDDGRVAVDSEVQFAATITDRALRLNRWRNYWPARGDTPRLAADVQRLTITLDGEAHGVSSPQAVRWVKVLAGNPGTWFGPSELLQADKELVDARTDKLRKHLPPQIDCLIESSRGRGSRIRLE